MPDLDERTPFDDLFDAMRGYIAGDLDVSFTGSPEAVEAAAVLLTKQLGLHLVGAEITKPQNVAIEKVRLKATLVLPQKMLQELLKLAKNDGNRDKTR